MKAIVVSPTGPKLSEIPVPVPGPEQILVHVRAAALNRADLHVAAGHRHGASGGPGCFAVALVAVPALPVDVHDLAGLETIGSLLGA